MLSDGTWTYTWEQGKQLKSASNNNTQIRFSYNASGLRTEKIVGQKTYSYIYNGDSLVAFTDGEELIGLIGSFAIVYQGETYYFVKNLQGDVIAITDCEGNIVVEYSYDAWGNILSVSGTKADTVGQVNPIRYRSYIYDPELNLYYLKTRYYSPRLGRFISADTLLSTGVGLVGMNAYAYCNNCPTSALDSNGMVTWEGIYNASLYGVNPEAAAAAAAEREAAKEAHKTKLREAQKIGTAWNEGDANGTICYTAALLIKGAFNPYGWSDAKGANNHLTVYDLYANLKSIFEDQIQLKAGGPDCQVGDDENLIAIRVASGTGNYHFYVRIDGMWYSNEGGTASWHPQPEDVAADVWRGGTPNIDWSFPEGNRTGPIYDGDIIYFSIKKDWEV